MILLAAAVAGGDLGVTSSPARPVVGHRVAIVATGQVSHGGRLYIYRNTSRSCTQTVAGERQRGIRLVARNVNAPFEIHASYVPHRVRREWVCSYLYSVVCDAMGNDCGVPTGLPPDAGFSQIPERIRR